VPRCPGRSWRGRGDGRRALAPPGQQAERRALGGTGEGRGAGEREPGAVGDDRARSGARGCGAAPAEGPGQDQGRLAPSPPRGESAGANPARVSLPSVDLRAIVSGRPAAGLGAWPPRAQRGKPVPATALLASTRTAASSSRRPGRLRARPGPDG